MLKAVVSPGGEPQTSWSGRTCRCQCPGQVRIQVMAVGVSPTDPKSRRRDRQAVFPFPTMPCSASRLPAVVDALGPYRPRSAGARAPKSSVATPPPTVVQPPEKGDHGGQPVNG